MAEAKAPSGDKDAHEEHHTNYVKIWGILVVLLIVSVLGPMAEIQVLTLITAFGIAIVKAYLVVTKFMHFDVEPKFLWYTLATTLLFMVLLFVGSAPDIMNHEGQNWSNTAAQAAVNGTLGDGEAVDEGPWVAATAFANTCGACHGTEGLGDGPAAAALDPQPANFAEASFWETRDAEHISNVIENGGPSVGKSALMPAFGAQFDAEQLQALVEHVMSFAPPVVEAPPEPEVSGDAGVAGDAATEASGDAAAEEAAAEETAPEAEAAE